MYVRSARNSPDAPGPKGKSASRAIDNAFERAFAAAAGLRLSKSLARAECLLILQPGLTMTSWHKRLALGRRQ